MPVEAPTGHFQTTGDDSFLDIEDGYDLITRSVGTVGTPATGRCRVWWDGSDAFIRNDAAVDFKLGGATSAETLAATLVAGNTTGSKSIVHESGSQIVFDRGQKLKLDVSTITGIIDRTITLADPGQDDTLTYLTAPQQLENKTVVMGVTDTIKWTRTKTLTMDVATMAADKKITFPDPGADDTLAYLNLTQTLQNKTITESALGSSVTITDDITMMADKDIIPNTDGEGELGLDTNRFKRMRAITVDTGDLRLANGWILTEAWDDDSEGGRPAGVKEETRTPIGIYFKNALGKRVARLDENGNLHLKGKVLPWS